MTIINTKYLALFGILLALVGIYFATIGNDKTFAKIIGASAFTSILPYAVNFSKKKESH